MFTMKSVAGCAILMCAQGLFAQQAGPRDSMQNVAQMSTNASVEVQQDLLSITMSTTISGADANSVQTQLKQALDAALAVARQQAIPNQMDIRTGNFSLYPRYDKSSKINGWQGTTELMLEGRDFSRITTTAAKIQTMTLANISFALSREQRSKVEGEAQATAIERFKAKAFEVAKGFGFTGYTLREININANDQGFQPRSRPMMSMAKSSDAESAPIPVEAGKSIVQVTVSGSVQMK